MSRMLRDETSDDPIVQFGARSLYICGEAYDNTASKFWSGLIDEAVSDYAGCNVVMLASTGSVPLSSDLLFPVNELQREIDRGEYMCLEDAIRLAEAELEMFGSPAAVQVILFAGKLTLKTRELPRECIDANVFSYLLAWLFQWGEIPERKWNDEFLSARLNADDLVRKLSYRMTIAYRNRHLSEGLYGRSVTVSFSREKFD